MVVLAVPLLLMAFSCLSSPGDVKLAVVPLSMAGWGFFVTTMVNRNFRTHKLRLLPSGVRVTENQQTTNWLDPEIARPQSLKNRSAILLSSADHKRPLEIELKYYELADQLAIIEHCSRFLSPEQQVQHGKDWIQFHAKLIAPPKPLHFPTELYRIHLSWLVCVLICLGIVQLSEINFPAGYTIWTPPMTLFVSCLLGVGLLFLYAGLTLRFYTRCRARQAREQPKVLAP